MDGDRILLEYKLPWQEVVSDLHDQVNKCFIAIAVVLPVGWSVGWSGSVAAWLPANVYVWQLCERTSVPPPKSPGSRYPR